MNLAISLRYLNLGVENAVWNTRWYAAEDYMHLARLYGAGVLAVLSKEAIDSVCGICGGHQALNVFFGGSLRCPPDSKAHENDNAHRHGINVVKASFVYDMLGSERVTVNSYHTWELNRIAPDLSVVATSDDGVAEVIEWKKHNVFATQWRPEIALRGERTPEFVLFDNFLAACEKCR